MEVIKKTLNNDSVHVEFEDVDGGAHLHIKVRDKEIVLHTPIEGFILLKYLQMLVGSSIIESAIVNGNPELQAILGHGEETQEDPVLN